MPEIGRADPLGRDRELRMLARHLRVGEHEITARMSADRDRARAEHDRGHLLARNLKDVRPRRSPTSRDGHRETRLDQRPPIEAHDAKDTVNRCELSAVIGSDR